VVREAAELKRRRTRTEPPPETPVSAADQTAPIDVWRALSALSHKLREVVVLRYFEDLSSPEIAAVVGIPEGTVRFRLMVARRRLRPLLDDYSERFCQSSGEARINAI
jgi:RNA polymerase sigma-70 factor (ECF subfamily)